MSRFLIKSLASMLLLALGAVAPCNAVPGLQVGDPAPALKVMSWVKGEPVTQFEKGKVYVVEFWATWCKPCVASMVRLGELMRRHSGQVIAVGVHSEAGATINKALDKYIHYIRTFIDSRGEAMAYANAVDDPQDPAVYRAWMAAAGFGGSPSATFVVDRAGRIAWIGAIASAEDALPQVLSQVLDGSVDLAAAKATHEADVAAFAALMAQQRSGPNNAPMVPVQQALERADYEGAVREAQKAIAAHPQNDVVVTRASLAQLTAWLELDEKRGLEYARKLLADQRVTRELRSGGRYGGGGPFSRIGFAIVFNENLSDNAYRFAIDCLLRAERESSDTEHLYAVLGPLSKGYERLGAIDKAIEAMQRTVTIKEKQCAGKPAQYACHMERDMSVEELRRLQGELQSSSRS